MSQTTVSVPTQTPGLSMAAENIDPVDIHVGVKIREQRHKIGMTQNALASQLGVSFQQVQKYERGANRVSMSMMKRVSDALGKPVGWFVNDYPGVIPSHEDDVLFQQWLAGREGQRWMKLGYELTDEARTALWGVARVLRQHGGKA